MHTDLLYSLLQALKIPYHLHQLFVVVRFSFRENPEAVFFVEMDQAREVIAASQKEAEETYSAMLEEFQSKYSQYQQKQATWTAAIKESKERELSDMQNRIQEFQANISQELQQQQNQLQAPIYEKANKAVQELAKAKGLTALFDATQALYFDESKVIDLTPEARKALGIAEGRTLESLQAELQEKAQAAQQQAQ